MLFNSLQFLFYFVLVTVLYYGLPHRFRWAMLLVASCYFYMAFVPEYILILAGTIVIDYFAAFWIQGTTGKHKKIALATSIVANVGILGVFKYYNFGLENLNELLGFLNIQSDIPYLEMILPIGLSFHTFQAMSYTIEVYYGRQKPERHFGLYALYVMFYPQLVAGPIERPQNILPQLHEKKALINSNVTSGLKLMAWGLFKKVVVSDRLDSVTSLVFNSPQNFSNWEMVVAAIFFTYQLYCDFSGYSDIARGSARVMGFDLMVNFNFPFYSQSVKELWTRWHISLNTWFRDYVYIPLGGNRVSQSRAYFNILFVFILSGIWHGAGWGFIFFGLINGIAIMLSRFVRPIFTKILEFVPLPGNLRSNFASGFFMLGTFLILTLSFIPFRCVELGRTMVFMNSMLDWNDSSGTIRMTGYTGLVACFFAILVLDVLQIAYVRKVYHNTFMKLPFWARAIAYNLFILVIIGFGVFEEVPFYYFQF